MTPSDEDINQPYLTYTGKLDPVIVKGYPPDEIMVEPLGYNFVKVELIHVY